MPTAPKPQKDPANWWHYSANQWWGCEKVSPACANCYAETFDKYAGRNLDPDKNLHWGKGAPRLFIDGFSDKMRRHNAIFAACPSLPRPRVFADSMNDWLDPAVPARWLWALLSTIKDCKAMDFLLCTKRPQLFPERMQAVHKEIPEARRSMDWWLSGGEPMNVWSGTTVESPDYQDRIGHLLKIGAAVRFLSVEPMLGPVDLHSSSLHSAIDWVICGGESGGQARPSNPAAIHSLRAQCAAAGVPFWFKQWGEWVGGKFDPRKSKVMLEDGRIYWINTKSQEKKLHFWGRQEGAFELVSARVGMNPKPIKLMGGPDEITSNYLLNGKIIRELPNPRRSA